MNNPELNTEMETLETQSVTTEKEAKENDIRDILNIDLSEETISYEKVQEKLFDCYRLIDEILEHKVDKFNGLKDFLLLMKDLIPLVKRYSPSPELANKLNEILKTSEKEIYELIDKAPSEKEIASELDSLLMKEEDIIDQVIDEDKNSKKNELLSSLDSSEINLSKIDKLYESLYEALEENNRKKATLYRGRIIRGLKKYQDKINTKYEEIKPIQEIKDAIYSNLSLADIKKMIEKYPKYNSLLKDSINDKAKLKEAIDILYEELKVKKIVLYKDALNHELLDQRNDLNRRYEDEFLEKKGTVSSVVKVLPNAMALAIKGLANTIDELKEAKTNRKKIAKAMDVAKATGKVIGTPVIYAGKFLASNWYAIYALYKGFLGVPRQEDKVKQEKEVEQQKNKPVEEQPKEHEYKPTIGDTGDLKPGALTKEEGGNIRVSDTNTRTVKVPSTKDEINAQRQEQIQLRKEQHEQTTPSHEYQPTIGDTGDLKPGALKKEEGENIRVSDTNTRTVKVPSTEDEINAQRQEQIQIRKEQHEQTTPSHEYQPTIGDTGDLKPGALTKEEGENIRVSDAHTGTHITKETQQTVETPQDQDLIQDEKPHTYHLPTTEEEAKAAEQKAIEDGADLLGITEEEMQQQIDQEKNRINQDPSHSTPPIVEGKEYNYNNLLDCHTQIYGKSR